MELVTSSKYDVVFAPNVSPAVDLRIAHGLNTVFTFIRIMNSYFGFFTSNEISFINSKRHSSIFTSVIVYTYVLIRVLHFFSYFLKYSQPKN